MPRPASVLPGLLHDPVFELDVGCAFHVLRVVAREHEDQVALAVLRLAVGPLPDLRSTIELRARRRLAEQRQDVVLTATGLDLLQSRGADVPPTAFAVGIDVDDASGQRGRGNGDREKGEGVAIARFAGLLSTQVSSVIGTRRVGSQVVADFANVTIVPAWRCCRVVSEGRSWYVVAVASSKYVETVSRSPSAIGWVQAVGLLT